jgi:hypothetical protein
MRLAALFLLRGFKISFSKLLNPNPIRFPCVPFHDAFPNPDADAEQTLRNLTVKTVRKQVEHDFGLSSGALDTDEIKLAIRKAVNDAVV